MEETHNDPFKNNKTLNTKFMCYIVVKNARKPALDAITPIKKYAWSIKEMETR